MRRVLIMAVILLAAGCQEGTDEQPVAKDQGAVKTYTIEQFLETISIGGGSFNADAGKLLIHGNATGIYNVYSVDTSTGVMEQLTDSTDTTFSVAYMPDSEAFLFTRDEGGNELFKLYLQDEKGTVKRLTRSDEAREIFYAWAQDLGSFFTGNNSRDPRFMDIYEWSLDTLEPTLIYENNNGIDLVAISRNKRWLALQEVHNDFDSDMYLVDRENGGEAVLISNANGEVNHFPQAFTPDGERLLYLTDRGSDFLYLMSYELATGDVKEIYRPDKWDVVNVDFSFNGTWRTISVNENAMPRHRIVNVKTGEEFTIADQPKGRITGLSFSRNEQYLRFYSGYADRPTDLYTHDIRKRRSTRLTDNLNPEIDPDDLVRPQLITMKARDGLEFYGYLYKPKLASPDEPHPVLLWIHGGPGGQSRPAWNPELQFLVNHGYGVFDLNYRGSGGFGRSFSMADDQKHGREPLYDCIDAKRWLIDNADWVDPDRIGILGGSYGGYMVMAALAFQPEAFDVGVNIFGVTNWERTLKSIPPWWESFKHALYRELGNPETQEDMLHAISPLFFADQISKPVIVLQGANDPRVLQVESDEMVANVRKAGGTAEYVLFEDEGHGFTKTANRIEGWTAILGFLREHL